MSLKPYKCKECGYEKGIDTNHYGECYSSPFIEGFPSYNACPRCPPYKRPNVWVFIGEVPKDGFVPEPWKNAKVKVKKLKKEEPAENDVNKKDFYIRSDLPEISLESAILEALSAKHRVVGCVMREEAVYYFLANNGLCILKNSNVTPLALFAPSINPDIVEIMPELFTRIFSEVLEGIEDIKWYRVDKVPEQPEEA